MTTSRSGAAVRQSKLADIAALALVAFVAVECLFGCLNALRGGGRAWRARAVRALLSGSSARGAGVERLPVD